MMVSTHLLFPSPLPLPLPLSSSPALPQAIFEQVDFKQANLAVQQSAERAFTDDDGTFDYVFNLAAETKYGQSPDVSWNICLIEC